MDTIEQPSGFLLIDKPQEWTSFDVIGKLRGVLRIKKIGHAGTLDPLATGLLIVAVGRAATKRIDEFVKQDKVYETTGILGEITDSYDAEGNHYKEEGEIPEFLQGENWKISKEIPTLEGLEKSLEKFTGEQQQIPPMFSAKKVQGKKLYELAREGKIIKRDASQITIQDLKLLSYEYPEFTLEVKCSSGTYIRSLVHDIGQDLEVGAYIKDLRRTQIGGFHVKDAWKIEDITKENFQEKFLQV